MSYAPANTWLSDQQRAGLGGLAQAFQSWVSSNATTFEARNNLWSVDLTVRFAPLDGREQFLQFNSAGPQRLPSVLRAPSPPPVNPPLRSPPQCLRGDCAPHIMHLPRDIQAQENVAVPLGMTAPASIAPPLPHRPPMASPPVVRAEGMVNPLVGVPAWTPVSAERPSVFVQPQPLGESAAANASSSTTALRPPQETGRGVEELEREFILARAEMYKGRHRYKIAKNALKESRKATENSDYIMLAGPSGMNEPAPPGARKRKAPVEQGGTVDGKRRRHGG